MLPLETLPPPGDPSGGVVYLRIVLSSKELSRMWVFINMNVLQGRTVSTSPNPQAGGSPLVGCSRLLIQFIRSYPPYRRPFLYPQPEDAPFRVDRDPLHGVKSLLELSHSNTYTVLETIAQWNTPDLFVYIFEFCVERRRILNNVCADMALKLTKYLLTFWRLISTIVVVPHR